MDEKPEREPTLQDKKAEQDIQFLIGIVAFILVAICIYISVATQEIFYGLVFSYSHGLDVVNELSQNLGASSNHYKSQLSSWESFLGGVPPIVEM